MAHESYATKKWKWVVEGWEGKCFAALIAYSMREKQTKWKRVPAVICELFLRLART